MSEKLNFQDRLLSLGLGRVSEAAALASDTRARPRDRSRSWKLSFSDMWFPLFRPV